MKNFKISSIMIIALVFAQSVYSLQVGKYDGGEYCYRIPGCKSRGMYPYGVCSQIPEDSMQRSGDADFAQDFSNESEFNYDEYWLNRHMNFEELRSFFPILRQLVKDQPLIYFDSAATAQMPQMVIDAIVDYYQNYKANVGRGLYEFAEHSTYMFENTRRKVAHFIGAQKQEIVFTSGATAGINLIAHIWAAHHINKGDVILVSEAEHNANFIPWQQLAKRKGIILKRIPVNEQGFVDIEILKTYLCEKTKLVAITHQSNILGTANDIAAITKAAHSVGAKVLVDAAQSIAHQKINVEKLQCDFLVFSGHKLFGPTGVGVLFIKQDLFDQLVLQNFGGGTVLFVTPEHTEFKCIPYCLEPGTQAIGEVIGLGAAIDFVEHTINFEQAQHHETALVRYLASQLLKIPGITLISPVPHAGQQINMVTFYSDKVHAYDIASYLDQYGIAVRAGFHCAQPYHDKVGGNATVRVSFTVYNTKQQVDFLIECLQKLFMSA